MRIKVNSYPLIALFFLLLFTLSILAEDYLKMIGRDWHPRFVTGKKVSLSMGGADYPCHVKAYGWKIVSKRREKLRVFGDLYIKWGWKIVVHNPGKTPINVSIKFELKSDEGFVLDSTIFGDYQDSSLNSLLYRGSPKWIYPGKTEIFQGVSTYNQSAHKGEGSPSYLHWYTSCEKVD
jgi:hypothetical protein